MFDTTEKSHINFYEGAMELNEIGSRITMARNLMNELELLHVNPQKPPRIQNGSQ